VRGVLQRAKPRAGGRENRGGSGGGHERRGEGRASAASDGQPKRWFERDAPKSSCSRPENPASSSYSSSSSPERSPATPTPWRCVVSYGSSSSDPTSKLPSAGSSPKRQSVCPSRRDAIPTFVDMTRGSRGSSLSRPRASCCDARDNSAFASPPGLFRPNVENHALSRVRETSIGPGQPTGGVCRVLKRSHRSSRATTRRGRGFASAHPPSRREEDRTTRVSPPTRRRDARGRDARQDSRRAAPAGRHLAPRARWRRTPQAQGAVRRPASRVGLHHERHREVQAHPRAGRGTRPARSRRVPFARRVPHSPCPPPSSRGSRPNRFCLGSRPRDAHFEIPPTTETTPPSSRRPRSSSSSPRTSPRHAPPSPVRAPGASPSAPVPATPTACSTRRTSKAQTRRAA